MFLHEYRHIISSANTSTQFISSKMQTFILSIPRHASTNTWTCIEHFFLLFAEIVTIYIILHYLTSNKTKQKQSPKLIGKWLCHSKEKQLWVIKLYIYININIDLLGQGERDPNLVNKNTEDCSNDLRGHYYQPTYDCIELVVFGNVEKRIHMRYGGFTTPPNPSLNTLAISSREFIHSGPSHSRRGWGWPGGPSGR